MPIIAKGYQILKDLIPLFARSSGKVTGGFTSNMLV